MKTVNAKPSIYIDFNKENNKEGQKFKISDIVRISKFLQKAMFQIILKKFLRLRTTLWKYAVSDLNNKENVAIFYIKNQKKQTKKSLELKK